MIRLPFRVYSLLDFEKYIPKTENIFFQTEINNEISTTIENLKEKSNPFLIVEKSEFENLEYALQILEDICARMSSSRDDFYVF